MLIELASYRSGWTQTGGDLLTIEAAVVQGKGREISTGKWGDDARIDKSGYDSFEK